MPEVIREVLAGLDLRGLVFDGLDLAVAVLHDCDLTGASMVGADWRDSCFGACRMPHSDWQRADVSKCAYFRCALDQADFRLAGCSETAFVECPLSTVTRLARSCGPHSAGGRAHRESPGRLQQPLCPTSTPGCCRAAYASDCQYGQAVLHGPCPSHAASLVKILFSFSCRTAAVKGLTT